MQDKRFEPRLMCADLVDVRWRDQAGRSRKTIANLEDISASGACLQIELEVPLGTSISISYPEGEYQGRVRYCVYREIGYFLGVQFEPGVRWTQGKFAPMHLFDPGTLLKEQENSVA